MNKKLEVKNLKISFRTMNGKVQAVRDISFDLFEGDTLAIVGESGSGKSVTSKAILGILAGNSIIEGGEIIYEDKNLLTIPEEEFHKIRGDKIAMIFQDPLSSLNPIMRIGRQLTEAMLLKGVARQKESRKSFNTMISLLSENMIQAMASDNKELAKKLASECKAFDHFEYKHLELEGAYNVAYESCQVATEDIDNMLFELSKNSVRDITYRVRQIKKQAKASIQTYVVNSRAAEILEAIEGISDLASAVKKDVNTKDELVVRLNIINSVMKEAMGYEKPNFFCMGYYLCNSKEPLPEMSVKELNAFLRDYLDNNFMLEFIANVKEAIKYSSNNALQARKAFVDNTDHFIEVVKGNFTLPVASNLVQEMDKIVVKSIDKLETVKDSIAYTFKECLTTEIKKYFQAISKNVKEQKRFDKEMAKYNAIIAKGKTSEWKPTPLSLIDLDAQKEVIVHQIERLKDNYIKRIEAYETRDFDAESINIIDYLKACASGVVNKVTPGIAKAKAIKLMEEVGIAEPRKRFYQYPFEFSGGMRQRIVIAIALAANPDILICDEPTTALDVTIQAQILELINELKAKRKLAIIFITHDLGVVANMADRIAVMYAGKIVEYGTCDDIFYRPAHPYTWALLSSMPDLDTNEKLEAIPGTPPNMIYPPKGDAFAERNKYALKIDFELEPPMFKISESHYAATWLLHENAPKIETPKVILDRIAKMKELNDEHKEEN